MTMNTCGTCEHFGPRIRGEREELTEKGLGAICHFLPEEQGIKYHACTLLRHTYGDNELHQPAFPVDGSGYFAALCVSDEFGCNQWSARDE